MERSNYRAIVSRRTAAYFSQHLPHKIKKVIVPRDHFQLIPVPNVPETNQNNYFDMASSNKCFQAVHGLPEIIIRRSLGHRAIKDKLDIILIAKKLQGTKSTHLPHS